MFSDARPAADEPAGLTVALRPYQLQTLQFMKDVEAAPGGYRSLFWLHCTGPRGEAYYYSPALRQLSLTVPEMDTGGFLGQLVHVVFVIHANMCRLLSLYPIPHTLMYVT